MIRVFCCTRAQFLASRVNGLCTTSLFSQRRTMLEQSHLFDRNGCWYVTHLPWTDAAKYIKRNTDIGQDIAPTYYDLSTFPKGDVKTTLQRTLDKIKRRQAMKGGR